MWCITEIGRPSPEEYIQIQFCLSSAAMTPHDPNPSSLAYEHKGSLKKNRKSFYLSCLEQDGLHFGIWQVSKTRKEAELRFLAALLFFLERQCGRGLSTGQKV